jgi:hypothetical protein
MARRRRPLRGVSLVFAGFVALVVLSQLSAHFFVVGIPKHLLTKEAAVVSGIQQTSAELAIAAAGLGLAFAGAVLLITRPMVAADIDVYRAAGLPSSSALFRVLRSHSASPLAWVAGAAVVAALVDSEFGLDAYYPIGLAVCFAAFLVAWLAMLTSISFSQRGFGRGSGGKAV